MKISYKTPSSEIENQLLQRVQLLEKDVQEIKQAIKEQYERTKKTGKK